MPRREVVQRLGRSYRLVIALVIPLLRLLTVRRWSGAENLPSSGGFLVCPNHISYADPMTLGHLLLESGHPPYFLAKESLFRLPVVGRVIRGAGQIPVRRDGPDASAALEGAVDALGQGRCIVIYPEGTLTRNPHGWPMVGRSGAARLALQTGCPVVPVAQWGPQRMWRPYTKRVRIFGRTTIQVSVGAPVDLDDLRGRPLDTEVLAEATERIMAAITELLRPLRPGEPPAQRFDPRASGPARGNPAQLAREAARRAAAAAQARRRG